MYKGVMVFVSLAVFALAQTSSGEIWMHPKCQNLASDHMGPFVNLADGSVLAVSDREALVSKDEGKTWEAHALFNAPAKFQARAERAVLRTREGVIIMAFLNEKEIAHGKWDLNSQEEMAKFYLPTYVVRSLDEGKTWEEPQKIQDGWCGAMRSLIQLKSGRIVLAGQQMVYVPCRHVVMSYASDDIGKTWKRSNVIELGGAGSHDGAMEGTLAELGDGRVWMLIRTTKGWFWETFSTDGGQRLGEARQSQIQSSTCCGQLGRLQSGRLVLLWNKSPEGKPYNLNSREELSISFSEDDGKTWSKPVVIARDSPAPGGKPPRRGVVSYPYVFERRPGELWITTMQGKLRISLRENDFITPQ